MEYLYQFLACLVVIFFVARALHTNLKIGVIAACVGAVGYVTFLLCPSPKVGFLLSSAVLTFLSEVFARACRVPSTIFVVLGIYPLVPGIALFETGALAVSGQYMEALLSAFDVIISLLLMAMAIAFVSVSFRIVWGFFAKKFLKKASASTH